MGASSITAGLARRQATPGQPWRFLLLDEPTASLDPGDATRLLARVLHFARSTRSAVVVVIHDRNDGARCAELVALLHEGRLIAHGRGDAVLTAERLQRCFGAPFDVFTAAEGRGFAVLPRSPLAPPHPLGRRRRHAMEHAVNPSERPAERPLLRDPDALARAWRALLDAEPKVRIRDAATRLGVSEAELRATECGAQTIRLIDDWEGILCRLPLVGEVMALTRNEAAVHEKIGEYVAPSFGGGHGLVLGQAIDLRLFLRRWAHGFAVIEEARTSLHFFDAHGDAIHKIYSREGSDPDELRKILEIFAADDQRPTIELTPRPARAPERADAAIDGDALRTSWLGMRDTHEFFGILRRHGVSRLQAMRHAPAGHARRVAPASLDQVLDGAARSGLPIMIFVGNPGCIQIHTGPVARIVPMGPWINVLDPGFNLHLRRDLIDQAWVVRKPTDDGIVTSLELFDAAGESIALLFGERKPGKPELPGWQALVAELADLSMAPSITD